MADDLDPGDAWAAFVEVEADEPPLPSACTQRATELLDSALARLGRVVLSRPLWNVRGRKVFIAHVVECDGRHAFVLAPAFEAAACSEQPGCERMGEFGAAVEARMAAARWFDTLADLQDHVADAYAQAPQEHRRLDGWRNFVEDVLALERPAGSDEPGGADAAAGSSSDGQDIEAGLRTLGEPLVRIEVAPTEVACGELLMVVQDADRFGLLLQDKPILPAATAAAASDADAPLPHGPTVRQLRRSVRWFESLGELQAHVLDDFSRIGTSDITFHRRPSWNRLKSAVRRLTRQRGDQPVAVHAGARARHVFGDSLHKDTRGRTRWSSDARWGALLWELGDVILLHNDAGRSGDMRVVLRKRGRFGFVVVGWGSCSGCDALQLCNSFRELEGVIRLVENGIRWFDTLQALQQYVADDAERQCSHYFHDPAWPRFRASVIALSPAIVGNGDLHLEAQQARALYPDAVSPRWDGDPRWESAYDHERLIGAMGEVLLLEWLNTGDGDDYLLAVILRSDAGHAFLLAQGSRDARKDPLSLCRHYLDIEHLRASMAAQLVWVRSLAELLLRLPGEAQMPGLSADGMQAWHRFLRGARELVPAG